MKLFARFFLILMLFALAPVLATGVWLLRSSEAARDNSRQLHQQVVALLADVVEKSVGDLNRALGFVQDLDRVGGDPFESYKILQRAAATHADFALLALLDNSGKETARLGDARLFPGAERGYAPGAAPSPSETSPRTAVPNAVVGAGAEHDLSRGAASVNRSSESIVAQALKTGRAAVGSVEWRENKPLLSIAHPLADGRCVYAVYDFRSLWRRVRDRRLGRTGRIVLLGPDGRPLPGMADDFLPADWSGKDLLSGETGWFEDAPTQKGEMVGAYQATPSLNWRVMSLQPRSEAFAVADRFIVKFAMFMLMLAGLAAVGSYWMSRHLARPLQALIDGAERVSENRFDESVPEIGWGEIKLLAQRFNEMMRVLQGYHELQFGAILEEKAKVEALVHTIPDGIILTSFDGDILYMNAKSRLLLDSPAIETKPKGRSVHDTLRDPTLRRMVLALMKRQKRSDEQALELKNAADAAPGFYLCRAATVMRGSQEIGILLILRDITVEKNLERMKEEFFHSIVHDLRNPLASVDGFIQIMTEKAGIITEKTLRSYLGYIQESLNNLRQLVSDILDSAKIESGTLELAIEPLSIPKLIEQLSALFLVQGERRGVTVRFECAQPSAAPDCDGQLIQRVIMNLIGNALKFTTKGGSITLRIAPAGSSEIEFAVQDTGIGIPQDKLDAVFEKFKQLDSGVAQRSGYGLGLSICKKIVELHGGRIWAESKPRQGSRFIFRLPLKSAVGAKGALPPSDRK